MCAVLLAASSSSVASRIVLILLVLFSLITMISAFRGIPVGRGPLARIHSTYVYGPHRFPRCKRSVLSVRSTSSVSSIGSVSPASSLLENKVAAFINNTQCIRPGDHVFLSVSGGVDSMAMMHVLCNLFPQSAQTPEKTATIRTKSRLLSLGKPPTSAAPTSQANESDVKLSVISFNHKFRPEADEEVAFVREIATKIYKLPFHEYVLTDGHTWKSGTQQRARAWRHSCYADCIAAEQKKDITSHNGAAADRYVVATAHHDDDQMETILSKVIRGGHISKYYGILPSREMKIQTTGAGVRTLQLARPVLSVSKNELISYMQAHNYEWREDGSNSQTDKYRRNAIRHKLIPLLADLARYEDDNDEDTVVRPKSQKDNTKRDDVNGQKDSGLALIRKRMYALAEQSKQLESFQQTFVDQMVQRHVRFNRLLRLRQNLKKVAAGPDRKGLYKFVPGVELDNIELNKLDDDTQVVHTAVADVDMKWFVQQVPKFLRTTFLKSLLDRLAVTPSGSSAINGEDDLSLVYDELKSIIALTAAVESAGVVKETKHITISSRCRAARIGSTLRLEVDHVASSVEWDDIVVKSGKLRGDSGLPVVNPTLVCYYLSCSRLPIHYVCAEQEYVVQLRTHDNKGADDVPSSIASRAITLKNCPPNSSIRVR
jgi:tRNA(Ile)-lysidine synthetase-like protein